MSNRREDAAGTPLATVPLQLQSRLSPRAMAQILRLQRLDNTLAESASWEKDFSQALEELEAIESVTASLFKTVIQLRRNQATYDNRMVQLEEEIQRVDGRLEGFLLPAKVAYQHAETALRKNAQAMERIKETCTDQLGDLQSLFKKTQCDLAILQSQWSAFKSRLDQLQDQLSPTEQKADTLEQQCAEMQRQEEALWNALQAVQTSLIDLERRTEGGFLSLSASSPESSLEMELQDASSRESVSENEQLSVAPVRDSDGWWNMAQADGLTPSQVSSNDVDSILALSMPSFPLRPATPPTHITSPVSVPAIAENENERCEKKVEGTLLLHRVAPPTQLVSSNLISDSAEDKGHDVERKLDYIASLYDSALAWDVRGTSLAWIQEAKRMASETNSRAKSYLRLQTQRVRGLRINTGMRC
ncbi:hypothetical protein C8Q73DRAFT_789751 [Cubamyces lactineus]|nr:hypothetical protein C8Q73DRAFT_789751 [Cubamyces lactineus]